MGMGVPSFKKPVIDLPGGCRCDIFGTISYGVLEYEWATGKIVPHKVEHMRKLQCLERAVAGKYERSFPLFYRYVIRRNIKKSPTTIIPFRLNINI